MKQLLHAVLDEIQQLCISLNVNPDVLYPRLQIAGYLVMEESEILSSLQTSTQKHLMMFTCLKGKDEKVFLVLQEFFHSGKWSQPLTFLQNKLKEIHELHLVWQPAVQSNMNSNEVTVRNINFEVKNPSVLFTGRKQELLQLHNLIQPCLDTSDANNVVHAQKCAIITGLGGTGKTQLVLRYAQLYNREYSNNILWINAESDSTIRSSFQRLASEKLNLNLKTIEGKKKTISSVVFEVYNVFSNTKALFIFDNADGPFSEHFFPTGNNKPFILITSRMQQWRQINVFLLNTLTEHDAIRFVKKGLKITDETQEDNIKNLVTLFQNFPLALQQAVAFITENNEDLQCIGSEYNIANYLIDYKVKAKSLLDHNINSYMGSHSSATTYTTWKVTIDKIKQNKNHGELAIKIFNLISCFASNKINPRIFMPLTEGNEYKLASAVKLLINYSMVYQVDRLLNVHPLVQEITLSDLCSDKNEMKECLQEAKNLLYEYFIIIDNFRERLQFVLPHIESLLSKIMDWVKNNPEENKISVRENVFNLSLCLVNGYEYFDFRKTISLLNELLIMEQEHFGKEHYQVATTLEHLGNAHGAFGDKKMQKVLLERALVIKEKHYGPEHYQVAITLVNLGNAHGALGDPKMQKELLERALAILEKHGAEHYQVAITLHGLGNAHADLGDPNMKKDLLERALAILEKQYGPEHYQVATTLVNLGNAHGKLGDPKMQNDLLEKALAIQEKHYGPEHFEVATTLMNLGNAHGYLGDPKMKKDLLERALAILEKHYGPECYEAFATLFHIVLVCDSMCENEMKNVHIKRALPVLQSYYGEDHIFTAIVRNILNNSIDIQKNAF